MIKGILQSDLFYCNHLGASESDERDVMGFVVHRKEGQGLANYIKYNAFAEEDAGLMRTYIVRDRLTSELVGYFSLKAGLISINEHDDYEYDPVTGEKIIDPETGKPIIRRVFETLPGIELANFAVNDAYIDNHKESKGAGLVFYRNFTG